MLYDKVWSLWKRGALKNQKAGESDVSSELSKWIPREAGLWDRGPTKV